MKWLKSRVTSNYGKGIRSNCGNYKEKSLLNSANIPYISIINKIITKISDNLLQEEQNTFCTRRSCIDNIFIVNQLIEKQTEFNLETLITFVDYENSQ